MFNVVSFSLVRDDRKIKKPVLVALLSLGQHSDICATKERAAA